MNSSAVVVAALYQFKAIKAEQLESFKTTLLTLCGQQQILGTLLIGTEGINGTVAGSRTAIDQLHGCLTEQLLFNRLTYKESFCATQPFLRLKVKIKKEIVTIGNNAINPQTLVGKYVKPKDWNQLIQDPEVLLIDTRNDYEIAIGKFKNAVSPETKNFREFPDYVQEKLNPDQHKKIAMYCTGGIRCEKASSMMLEAGFAEVYHLEGGILQYLADVPEDQSLWQGSCFVFDERVAVDHELKPAQYQQCFGCRHPLTPEEATSELTIKGICCPYCHDQTTEQQKQRFSERQKQMKLAKKQGKKHLGQSLSTQQES